MKQFLLHTIFTLSNRKGLINSYNISLAPVRISRAIFNAKYIKDLSGAYQKCSTKRALFASTPLRTEQVRNFVIFKYRINTMIDLDIIREKYASMTDEQLIHLAQEDSGGLTDEAMMILKQEFDKRCLNINEYLPVEKDEPGEEDREPMPGSYNPATGADDALLGRSYLSLQDPARETKLAENEKNFLADLTEEDAQTLIKKCNRLMLINGIIFLIGIIVTLATFLSVAETGGTYFVAWGAIIFGGFGFFRAFDAKNKYKAALKDIPGKQEELPKSDHDL